MTKLINRIITVKAENFIARLIAPLNKLGISGFSHDITFGQQKVALTTDNVKKFKFYYDTQYPMICTNEQGRILPPGIYLKSNLLCEHADYRSLYPYVCQKFQFSSAVHFIEIENDCQHMYSFTSSLNEQRFTHMLINHLNDIKVFLQCYKNKASDIIGEAKKPKNIITLPYFDQVAHFNNNMKLFPTDSCSYEKKLLTEIQLNCLKLLSQGNTAKQIALKMERSPRTIEHYLDNIKEKLKCKNSKELIAYYIALSQKS